MSAEIEFELTEDELAVLLQASRPVPYLVFGGVETRSPQQNANAAWQHLARERGFVWDTVRTGRDQRHFFAAPSAPRSSESDKL